LHPFSSLLFFFCTQKWMSSLSFYRYVPPVISFMNLQIPSLVEKLPHSSASTGLLIFGNENPHTGVDSEGNIPPPPVPIRNYIRVFFLSRTLCSEGRASSEGISSFPPYKTISLPSPSSWFFLACVEHPDPSVIFSPLILRCFLGLSDS